LELLASLWDLTKSDAPKAERREAAAALRRGWLAGADVLAEALPPELQASAPEHREWFTEAVLLWIHFGRVAGTPRLDTIKTNSLRRFPVDLESGEAHRPAIRGALREAFGWTDAELDGFEARIDRLISNLEIKHAISATFVDLALSDGTSGLQVRAAELMRDVYGAKMPFRSGDVGLVVSASAVYFCLAYRGDRYKGPGFDERPAEEQAALNGFLERLRRANTFRTARFPSFGLFELSLVSSDFLDALHRGTASHLGHEIRREVVVETFETMTMVLPTELADQYLVHDAWGHGWQEALCEFEWLYGDVVHLRESLALDTGRRAGRPEGARLGDAFRVVEGRTVLDEDALLAVVEADLRHRIGAAGNTFLSEVLADLVEHKYVRQVNPSDEEFPTSSLLPQACLKVDLSLVDSRSYGRAWSAAYRRLIGRKAVRARFASTLAAAGRPKKGLRAAVDRAATLISTRFATALRSEYEHPVDDPDAEGAPATVVQRLALSALAMDAEITTFIERGEAILERERAANPDVARWRVPESCIDLLVVALAWFFEQERDAYIWHLDELLRGALGPSFERFGEALRAQA
jgi:hypothetical protein